MFKTIVHCPNCRNEIALEDARTELTPPGQSTWRRTVKLVYTVCPRCRRDFRVQGEKRAALAILVAFFGILAIGFFIHSWWPLVALGTLLLLQKKIMQLLIRAVHA